LHFIPIQ